MSQSIDAIRGRLDSNLQNSLDTFYTTAYNMDTFSSQDWHFMHNAHRQLSMDSWAANQEIQVSHNLMKAIIEQIR